MSTRYLSSILSGVIATYLATTPAQAHPRNETILDCQTLAPNFHYALKSIPETSPQQIELRTYAINELFGLERFVVTSKNVDPASRDIVLNGQSMDWQFGAPTKKLKVTLSAGNGYAQGKLELQLTFKGPPNPSLREDLSCVVQMGF
ncbi:MAG: hypothetical protein AB7P04_09655 [Bacteriovoracia bacterium]